MTIPFSYPDFSEALKPGARTFSCPDRFLRSSKYGFIPRLMRPLLGPSAPSDQGYAHLITHSARRLTFRFQQRSSSLSSTSTELGTTPHPYAIYHLLAAHIYAGPIIIPQRPSHPDHAAVDMHIISALLSLSTHAHRFRASSSSPCHTLKPFLITVARLETSQERQCWRHVFGGMRATSFYRRR